MSILWGLVLLMKSYICIDPGTGTGIAVIEDRKLIHYENIWGKGKNFKEKADSIIKKLEEDAYDADKVWIEWPTGRFSGAKGLAAANSDAILKLCYLIGRIAQYFESEKIEVELLPVWNWRGQVPDHVLEERVWKFWNNYAIKAHSIDAAGIARYLIMEGIIK